MERVVSSPVVSEARSSAASDISAFQNKAEAMQLKPFKSTRTIYFLESVAYIYVSSPSFVQGEAPATSYLEA